MYGFSTRSQFQQLLPRPIDHRNSCSTHDSSSTFHDRQLVIDAGHARQCQTSIVHAGIRKFSFDYLHRLSTSSVSGRVCAHPVFPEQSPIVLRRPHRDHSTLERFVHGTLLLASEHE